MLYYRWNPALTEIGYRSNEVLYEDSMISFPNTNSEQTTSGEQTELFKWEKIS